MPKIPLDIQIQLGLIKVNERSPVLHKLWKNTNKNGPIHPIHGQCWEWAKSIVDGYGQFQVLGECRAHRVSYKLLVGEIPQGLSVLHKCDNRKCIRPEHLFLGTNQDNMDDMKSKGRSAKGERNISRKHPEKFQGENNGRAKLTNSIVLELRDMYAQGYTRSQLARLYNLGWTTVDGIVRRMTWKHL